MTRTDAFALARLGTPIRRPSWPTAKTIVFSAGKGTVRAVGMLVNGSTLTVLKAGDLTQADLEATDWRAV